MDLIQSHADIVFDHSTVFRVSSPEKKDSDLIVKILPGQLGNFEWEMSHPLHARNTEKRVFRGTLETYHHPSAKHIVPDPPVYVAVKWTRREENIGRLRYETEMYQTHLGSLQGIVVPRFYGFYEATIEDVYIACIVLEWCEINPKLKITPIQLDRLQTIAMGRLHQHNIFHGNILDMGHFLQDAKGMVRIIDFSTAQTHVCEDPTGNNLVTRKCGELYELQLLIWKRSKFPAETEKEVNPVKEAVKSRAGAVKLR